MSAVALAAAAVKLIKGQSAGMWFTEFHDYICMLCQRLR